MESYDVGEGEEKEVDEGKDESDEEGVEGEGDKGNTNERTTEVGSSGSPGHTHPFILPSMWAVNDFLPKMMTNIFKNLKDRYQIPDHIPICLPGKFEKCYSGKTANIGMYDTTFTTRPRLPLMALNR